MALITYRGLTCRRRLQLVPSNRARAHVHSSLLLHRVNSRRQMKQHEHRTHLSYPNMPAQPTFYQVKSHPRRSCSLHSLLHHLLPSPSSLLNHSPSHTSLPSYSDPLPSASDPLPSSTRTPSPSNQMSTSTEMEACLEGRHRSSALRVA